MMLLHARMRTCFSLKAMAMMKHKQDAFGHMVILVTCYKRHDRTNVRQQQEACSTRRKYNLMYNYKIK